MANNAKVEEQAKLDANVGVGKFGPNLPDSRMNSLYQADYDKAYEAEKQARSTSNSTSYSDYDLYIPHSGSTESFSVAWLVLPFIGFIISMTMLELPIFLFISLIIVISILGFSVLTN